MQVTTVGLDLAKDVFRSTASPPMEPFCSIARFDVRSFSRSSKSCPRASSAWKLADPPITGRARSVSSGTKFG